MPETPFVVELPDGSTRTCYSPSSVVRQYFSLSETLSVEEFVSKARSALSDASARVEAKFGYSCSGATASVAKIERWSSELAPDETVKIINI